MVIVKIIFMIVGFAGDISFLRAGSLSRNNFKDHVRVRRGFRSYFYNYLDEIAMATCAAIPSNGPGLIYAVRRIISSFAGPQPKKFSANLSGQELNQLIEQRHSALREGPKTNKLVCINFSRTCGEKTDCKHICTEKGLRQQGPKDIRKLTWDCTESLHVYKRQPALADNYDEDTDSHKLGLAVFRHHSCAVSKCGPNYCCCRAVAL